MADEPQVDQGSAVPPQAKQDGKRSVSHVRKAENLGLAAGGIGDEISRARKEVWEDACHPGHSFDLDSRQYVRATPTRAAFAALGVRLLLGLIFRR